MLPAKPTCQLRRNGSDVRQFLAFERTLGENLKPFMAEVYLVNAGVMASYIYAKRQGNLADIVTSSAEALHRPGMLRYARQAAIDFDWNCALAITLRMEFVHDSLTALFDLVFNADYVGIDIIGIDYREAVDEPGQLYAQFASAVAELKRTDD
jgi:hypothetical protein